MFRLPFVRVRCICRVYFCAVLCVPCATAAAAVIRNGDQNLEAK